MISVELAKKLRDAGLSILWGQTLPTLPGLLAELDARGYYVSWVPIFTDGTPEDIVGQALLCVLEQGKR